MSLRDSVSRSSAFTRVLVVPKNRTHPNFSLGFPFPLVISYSRVRRTPSLGAKFQGKRCVFRTGGHGTIVAMLTESQIHYRLRVVPIVKSRVVRPHCVYFCQTWCGREKRFLFQRFACHQFVVFIATTISADCEELRQML